MLLPTKLVYIVATFSLLLIGCNKAPKSSFENQQQADQAIFKVADLTAPTFDKQIQQIPLDDTDKEKLQEALPIARDLYLFDSSRRDYASILGKILIGLDEGPEARLILRKALRSNAPTNNDSEALIIAGIHADLAQISFDEGKYDLAIEDIRTATLTAPNDPHFVTLAARIFIEKDEPEEAMKFLNVALQSDPGYLPAIQLKKLIELPEEPTESP